MTDKEKIRAEIIKRRKAIPKEEDDKRMKAVYGGITKVSHPQKVPIK